MANFYSAWLANSERIEKAIGEAPRVARGKELNWIRTRQDHKAALMIAPETGFPTGGSLLMKAEIPIGWHTGKHVHGEEAIYIERGQGFLLLDGERFDFPKGNDLSHSIPRVASALQHRQRAGCLHFWFGVAVGGGDLYGAHGTD